MSIYGLLEHVRTQQEEAEPLYNKEADQSEISEDARKAMDDYRIITTARGLCNDLPMTKSPDPAIFIMGF